MNSIIDETYATDFTETGEAFKIQTPTTLNLIADVQVIDHVFLNATAAINITGRSERTIDQYDTYVLSACYETGPLELAVPLSMMDMRAFKPGFKLRIYGFTLGTDDVRWFFNSQHYYSSIYFGIHFRIPPKNCGKSSGIFYEICEQFRRKKK